MTEEINKEELAAALVEGKPEETGEEAKEEYSEIESQAIEHGWRPEGVDGKKNLSADEFMDRQHLYDDIRSLKKQNRRLEDGMDALTQHNKTVVQRERTRTIEELKAQKKHFLEQENFDAVVEIDEKIADTKAIQDSGIENKNADFETWVDNNEWYHDNPDMKAHADMIGAGYYQQNPNKSMAEVYEYVSKEVKDKFVDKFKNTKRERPNPVEGAVKGRPVGGKQHSVRDLPEEDRQIMRTIVRAGGISEEEYLKQYFG